MTIKEVEERTGMTRANVRFYENEGLIEPARTSNGYRDYSKEDVDVLMRIKLLRALHMSLDEIKCVQNGEQELVYALGQLTHKLQNERDEAEAAEKICRTMQEDMVRYDSLDARRYLERIEDVGGLRQSMFGSVQDVEPEICIPWRRYFARTLDLNMYTLLWYVFLTLVLKVDIINRGALGILLDNLVACFIMVIAEPIFLAWTGTTPGKAILGISVMHSDERRLTYRESLVRTWKLFLYGMGLSVPVLTVARYIKSYNTCNEGGLLEWESRSDEILQDTHTWRTVVCVAAYLVITAVIVVLAVMAKKPFITMN